MNEPQTVAGATSRRRGRGVLIGILVVAVAVLAAPPILQAWFESNACPIEVTQHGFAEKVRWEVSRSDCGGGRIVHQLRIIPPKGYSVLAYESEGAAPLPLGWSQTRFTGRVRLDRPIDGETASEIDIVLDPKGRPTAPVMVREGKRRPVP